ncbi:MAG: beta-glucuronidase, partial [Eubacterium sp.]|nr:beta-glucuronidase [Eubacterium sp.]
MLYPQMNEKRFLTDLDGIWNFCFGSERLEEKYLIKPIENPEKIYVPASYNDQKADIRFRDHYGYVYYQTYFSIPSSLRNNRIVLRFGAVTHNCVVYLNAKKIAEHTGGFLPFEIELDDSMLEEKNLLSVAVDNRVDFSTLPVGNESKRAMFGDSLPNFDSVNRTNIKNKNYPNFDFFNYCGINRSVKLYTTAKDYIKDVYVDTRLDGVNAVVRAEADLVGSGKATVSILDDKGNEIISDKSINEEIHIENAKLWQPGNAYLYTAKITFYEDCYYQKFGVREVEVKDNQFLINGKSFYFKGFGKHEDSEIHGRGIDEALNVKDISLMKWMCANSFRTSHYPYSEEMLNLCDEAGIVVIAETPAVGLNFPNIEGELLEKYNKRTEHHRQVIQDMIARDKNHPSIVMWSLANEPDTAGSPDKALDYFKPFYHLAHKCDPQSRPVTVVVCNNDYIKDKVAPFVDVICINRYYGWYIFAGDLDAASQAMDIEMQYFSQFNKPLMITEYGADTVAGVHNAVPNMFSEEFQVEYYDAMNAVLDKYKFVVGEQTWNFADFQTIQGVMRVDGNKKGIFTRDRRPKL